MRSDGLDNPFSPNGPTPRDAQELRALATDLHVRVDVRGRGPFVLTFAADESDMQQAATFEDAVEAIRCAAAD